MAPPRIADQLGRVLGGRFRLVAPLGTGASAHVYVAEDVSLRRRVAVKVLHPALAQDETFLRRFRTEAQAVAALRHPHIMQVFDWGEDDDGPYLVLEYLAGGSLRDLLDADHRLTPSQALLVGLHASQALAYAHRRGLVHRDIKPANLLFDDEGRVVIADFGLARALAEAAWTEPAGSIVGTARYASPEQARGSRVDGSSDVYSLALVLIEAVTGRVPFASDTTIATLMARVDRPVEVPPELGPLAPALEAATAIDPTERIVAGELALQLDRTATSLPRPDPLPIAAIAEPDAGIRDLTVLPEGSRDARPFDDAHERSSSSSSSSSPTTPATGRRWRRRLRNALVVVVAIAIAAAAAAYAVQAGKPEYPVPDLAGMTLAQARAAVADEGFDVVRTAGRYDEQARAGTILSQSPFTDEELTKGRDVRVVVSRGPQPRAVPDLAGKTAADARRLVEEQRLVYQQVDAFSDTVDKGIVVDWSPKGTQPRDTTITVTVSKGKEPKALPGLVDKLYDEARKLLEDLGFVTKRADEFSDDVEKGKIVETRPPEGTEAQPGDEVVLVVSKGPDLVEVPDVSGLSVQDAVDRLHAAGLEADGVDGSPARTVRASRPPAGSTVKRGSGVELITRRD